MIKIEDVLWAIGLVFRFLFSVAGGFLAVIGMYALIHG